MPRKIVVSAMFIVLNVFLICLPAKEESLHGAVCRGEDVSLANNSPSTKVFDI